MTGQASEVPGFISQFFTKLDYLMRETLLGLRRGGWLNWAAVSTLMVLLFLVGSSLQLSWGLESTLESLGSQVEISAFLKPEVAATSLESDIAEMDGVEVVRSIPKDDAWQALLEAMGTADPQTTVTELGANPLVDSLRIQAKSTDFLPAIAGAIEQLAGVDEVYYGSEVVTRLGQLRDGVNVATVAITGGLTLTTVAVITTTIRLIVMARRREIEVMALVGATSTWIYMPFILQGIVFGIVGAIVAWGAILGTQQLMGDVLSHMLAMPFLQVADLNSRATVALLPLILLGVGTFLGATGSLIAVRKTAMR